MMKFNTTQTLSNSKDLKKIVETLSNSIFTGDSLFKDNSTFTGIYDEVYVDLDDKTKIFIDNSNETKLFFNYGGLTKEDIEIELDGNILKIKPKENKSPFKHKEYSYKTFNKHDISNIEAKMENGVLEITIPIPNKKTNITIN